MGVVDPTEPCALSVMLDAPTGKHQTFPSLTSRRKSRKVCRKLTRKLAKFNKIQDDPSANQKIKKQKMKPRFKMFQRALPGTSLRGGRELGALVAALLALLLASLSTISQSNALQQNNNLNTNNKQQAPQSMALLAANQTGSAAGSKQNPSANQAQAKLFEVCKLQSRQHLQLTNLSQIMFQPAEICSSWYKMIKTPPIQQQQQNKDSNNVEVLDDASSYPWSYIELLDLSQNNLTVLRDNDGFNRLAGLLELRITQNSLSRCEENSLVGLQKLQILDISHNKLMALPTKFFQPVRLTIKKLNLSFNSISVLVPTLFDSLANLEYLDLSHNEITSHWINDRLFKNLTNLHYLDLSFNRLTVFSSPMTFHSLQQLETLSLQHNELRQVPETIQHLRYLSTLDLSQNLIHDVTNASYLSNCRLLFNLNLESNLLENITRDAFSDLPALKVLNLANNRIQHLDQQAFDCKYNSFFCYNNRIFLSFQYNTHTLCYVNPNTKKSIIHHIYI